MRVVNGSWCVGASKCRLWKCSFCAEASESDDLTLAGGGDWLEDG